MYPHTSTQQTAAPEGADNAALAKAWAHWFNTGSADGIDALGKAIDDALKQRIPSGVLPAAMRSLEDEEDVRQEAAEMLFARYLRGNRKLIEATHANDIGAISRQISRSVNAAAGIVRKRSLRRHAVEQKRREIIADSVEGGLPLERPGFKDGMGLPRQARMSLAKAALKAAVVEGSLSKDTAVIAQSVLDGLQPSELARERGVTRAAISERLKRAACVVGNIIQRKEPQL